MTERKNISLSEELYEKVKRIQNDRGLTALTHTIEYLCDDFFDREDEYEKITELNKQGWFSFWITREELKEVEERRRQRRKEKGG